MKLQLINNLPFVTATFGESLVLDTVLLDTGSGRTLLSADKAAEIGLFFEQGDAVQRVRGVGGVEFVFTKSVSSLSIGELITHDFAIQVGEMNYGFELDAIIGMDFLNQVNAVIDLARLEIYQGIAKS